MSPTPRSIWNENDRDTVIPKQNCVFVFGVPLYSTGLGGDVGTVLDGPHVELELYGNQFRFRSSDRASRKFKHKESVVIVL